MISRLDADIGRLFVLLKRLGIDENTLVMFSSDNDPQNEGGNPLPFFRSGGPLRGMKRDLYEGGIRVPFLARWPGQIPAGSVSDHIGYFGDLTATAAEPAGVQIPADLNSISFVPVLRGQADKQRTHEYLYWEFHEGGFKQAVRMGDWKAVRLGVNKPVELYNLASDLGEKNDMAAAQPEKLKELRARLDAVMSDAVPAGDGTADVVPRRKAGSDRAPRRQRSQPR